MRLWAEGFRKLSPAAEISAVQARICAGSSGKGLEHSSSGIIAMEKLSRGCGFAAPFTPGGETHADGRGWVSAAEGWQISSRPSMTISLSVDAILARHSLILRCVQVTPMTPELMLRNEFRVWNRAAREHSSASPTGSSDSRQPNDFNESYTGRSAKTTR